MQTENGKSSGNPNHSVSSTSPLESSLTVCSENFLQNIAKKKQLQLVYASNTKIRSILSIDFSETSAEKITAIEQTNRLIQRGLSDFYKTKNRLMRSYMHISVYIDDTTSNLEI